MSNFKIGDLVKVGSAFDGEADFADLVGTVRHIQTVRDGNRIGVDFAEEMEEDDNLHQYTHDLGGNIRTNTGYYGSDYELSLLSGTRTAMSPTGGSKAMFEEIGDAILAKKAKPAPTLSSLTLATEYRSSMASSSSIRPSMIIRLGRPLTVQGKRIY